MIVVVLDTNVLVSGFLSERGIPGQIIDRWRAGEFAVIISEPVLDEFMRTLLQPYFQQRLTREQIAGALFLLRIVGIETRLTAEVHGVASHPEDDLILATAVSAKADFLITGDRQLQKLQSYEGVSILSPRAFLEVLMEPGR